MRLRFGTRDRHGFPTEEELIQADVRLQEASSSPRLLNCLGHPQLERFATGKYSPGDAEFETIAEHLLDCDACLAIMAELRSNKGVHTSRLLVAALATLLLAICFWVIRVRVPVTVATADLRQVTRSSEGASILLEHDARALRVVLPVGSNNGEYEIGIFKPGEAMPILARSSRSRHEGGALVIRPEISLERFTPGPYLLGVRYAGSEWNRYAIEIK